MNKFQIKNNASKACKPSVVKPIRTGCKDTFHAFMVKGAEFDQWDIPICQTTGDIPNEIICWNEAIRIYNLNFKDNKEFFYNAYICFYVDDIKFDGIRGVWYNYEKALEIIRHFAGIITPDFSTNVDFPLPLKLYNTYRMRAFGCWMNQNNIPVINNVRWGNEDTHEFTFNGIEKHSIVAIGTVGGSPKNLDNRERFENGLNLMVQKLEPKAIIVYGSSNYDCFNKLKDKGIKIYTFKSQTAKAYEERDRHVQKL